MPPVVAGRLLRSLGRWLADHPLAGAGIAGGLALVLVAVVSVSYLGARRTSAPSVVQALKAFRAHSPSPSPTGADASASPVGVTPSLLATPTTPTPSPSPSPSPSRRESAPSPGASAAATPCGWDCPYQGPPEAGVYQWFQCGATSGECTGDPGEPQAMETIILLVPLTRALPRTGVRTVTGTGPNQWHLSHAYANEHHEDFDVSGGPSGIYSTQHSIEVSLLGIDNTTSIVQTPPFPAVLFPLAVGKTWSGHWKDSNGNADADYTSTVLDKTQLTIGGQLVQTWAVDWRFKLLGPKTTGDVDFKSWIAPRYSQTVQESQSENLTSGGTSYQGNWTITLASLQPSR